MKVVTIYKKLTPGYIFNHFKFKAAQRKRNKEWGIIEHIILNTPAELKANNAYTPLMEKCDVVFIDRLEKFPVALTLGFWLTHFELNSLEQFPEIRGDILDFGCGSGHLDILLARKGYLITGIDPSPIGIRLCKHLLQQEKIEIKKRLHFIERDVTEPNISGKLFDNVWSTQVFEHLPDPAPFIKGLRQYVKPGAYMLICVPFGNAYDDPDHCNYFYSQQELSDFLSSHIGVVKIVHDKDNEVLRALCQF